VQAARRASLERANEVLRERKAAGLHTPAGWGSRDPREVSARGHEKLAELRNDPEWRAAFARKVSEARGGRLKVTCVVCGKVFAEPQSHKGRKTCSPECFGILRRRMVAERRDRFASDRTDRQHRGVELGERRRRLGRSIEDVARQSGLSAAHVSRIERGLNVPSNQALGKIEQALDNSEMPASRPEGAEILAI
jgi:ribosome-binding protein aMBF1 (putative translation factor)